MLRDSDVVFFDVNSKKIYHEDTGNVIDESKYNILVQQVSCHDPPDKNSKVGGLAEEIERRTGVRDRSEEGKPWPMGSISIFQKYFAAFSCLQEWQIVAKKAQTFRQTPTYHRQIWSKGSIIFYPTSTSAIGK